MDGIIIHDRMAESAMFLERGRTYRLGTDPTAGVPDFATDKAAMIRLPLRGGRTPYNRLTEQVCDFAATVYLTRTGLIHVTREAKQSITWLRALPTRGWVPLRETSGQSNPVLRIPRWRIGFDCDAGILKDLVTNESRQIDEGVEQLIGKVKEVGQGEERVALHLILPFHSRGIRPSLEPLAETSKIHAVIKHEDGEIYLRDESTHGCFLEAEFGFDREIRPGDALLLGEEYRVDFVDPAKLEDTDLPEPEEGE